MVVKVLIGTYTSLEHDMIAINDVKVRMPVGRQSLSLDHVKDVIRRALWLSLSCLHIGLMIWLGSLERSQTKVLAI